VQKETWESANRESVSIAVQASGNAGDYPLSQSPTTGVKLSTAVAGGYKTTTIVAAPTQFIGDVSKSGNKSPLSARVAGLQGRSLSSATPYTTDTLRYNEYGDSAWDVVAAMPRCVVITSDGE